MIVVEQFLYFVGVFYLLYLIGYASYLFISIVAGALYLYKRDRMRHIKNEIKHNYYYPISIIIPAYNEEVTIVDSVRSMLDLEYRLYEIVVVDDGSSDQTSQVLMDTYKMVKEDRPIRIQIPCGNIESIHEATVNNVKITLVRKMNGGKGDALNTGINVSEFPYFICVDADSLLQSDSLENIIQPVLEAEHVVAVAGLIRISQCVNIRKGKVEGYKLPFNPITGMQVLEYDRSFMASRILMDGYNGNLIISGAFGLFKKDIVISAGGYATDTLGEDMDLAVKLHVFCRNNQIPYSIRYETNAICWSQAPTNMKDLGSQRRRWYLGLFQCMYKYHQIFFNMRFGLVSFISYMYYILYELLSPFIEIFGIFTVLLGAYYGFINIWYMIILFLIYELYNAILTLTAFFQRVYSQNLKLSFSDIIKAIVFCLFESTFFRHYLSFVRITSFIGYHKKKTRWGSIARTKQN